MARSRLDSILVVYFAIALLSVVSISAAARDQTLTIGYPPDAGIGRTPDGFAIDYMRAADLILRASGLSTQWVELPITRMLRDVQFGAAPFCIGGATVSAEREVFGQFSRPFRVDRKLVLLGLKSHATDLAGIASFGAFVERDHSALLAIKDLNYGEKIAPLLRQLGPRVSFTAHSVSQLIAMLRGHRAAFGIVPQNIARTVMAASADKDNFVMVSYPDLLRDAKMGFLCNKAVPAEVIATLNATIARLLPQLHMLFPDQVDLNLR